MSATYDTATQVGQVRLLCLDRDIANPIFSDEEITAFINLQYGSGGEQDAGVGVTLRAAADALDTIAANEAYVLKATNILGVSTNGPAVAAAIYTRATALRTRADALDSSEFEVVEWVTDDFQFREYLDELMLRTLV